MPRRRTSRFDETPPWRSAVLFEGLDEDALAAIATVIERHEIPAGTYIAHEGERATDLFWVESGALELLKKEARRDVEHRIDAIQPGDCIGELALIDGLPRAASARTIEPSVVWALPLSELARDGDRGVETEFGDVRDRLVQNLTRVLSSRLRGTTSESLEAAQERAAMGQFIVNVVILLVVYLVVASALPYVRDKLPSSTSYVSIPLQVFFAWGSWTFMRNTGFARSRFGLGFRHLFGSIAEAAVLTPPFLALVTALKWV